MLWGNYSFTHPHCVWRTTVITYVNTRSSYKYVTTDTAAGPTAPNPASECVYVCITHSH